MAIGIVNGQTMGEVGRAISRDPAGRLPDGAALGFATLTHSNLKSYAKIEAAEGHNTRAKNTPNARSDAPRPVELLEEQSGSYVDRVKAILAEHGSAGVPVKPRRNSVIACEDIYGASPEYWNRNGNWREKTLDQLIEDPVIQGALELARRTHGPRLVSCSLHVPRQRPWHKIRVVS